MTKKTKSHGVTPAALKFNAGGRTSAPPTASASAATPSPRPRDIPTRRKNTPDKHSHKTTMMNTRSNALTVLQTGLRRKRSPLHLQNWIACVLTLDGRDKFTKLLQYLSRFLSWYFLGLASSAAAITSTASSPASSTTAPSLASNPQLQLLCTTLSTRFQLLYKSLVDSRKAFRLGRSFIELDKLKGMGWGEYVKYTLLHPLDGGGVVEQLDRASHAVADGKNGGIAHPFGRYDTHPIEEGDEDDHCDEDDHEGGNSSKKDVVGDHAVSDDEHDDDDDEASWNEDDEDDDDDEDHDVRVKAGMNATNEEEKKWDGCQSERNGGKAVSRPNRPVLPSRISSNIGWGPATTAASSSTDVTMSENEKPMQPQQQRQRQQQQQQQQSHPSPPPRTVSEMGRQMYRPFPSRSSSMGSYKQLREPTPSSSKDDALPTIHPTATPTWKLVGGTLKLLGLMGFWACDNMAFLTGSGFLDPISLTTSSSSSSSSSSLGPNVASSSSDGRKETRMRRKAAASAWGARFYFVASIAGLVVNWKEISKHRSGALRKARCELRRRVMESGGDGDGDGDGEGKSKAVETARAALKAAEGKHFELILALLKSMCDFMVFSNNPGVDLHLKFRGKKNHEALHCLGGLISASTVLYSNFPNSDKY